MIQQNPTFLAIGDTVVDAFIELIDAEVTCKVDNADCHISMRFGDKIPFKNDYVLYGVGNPANASVSFARLGYRSSLLTHLGDDDNGHKTVKYLESQGITGSTIILEKGVKTNYHYILWYKPERTILVKHEHYNYNFKEDIARISELPDWVYFSSLAEGTDQYHADIDDWLTTNPSIKLTFQPNTFQMKMGIDTLRGIYNRTELFFANIEEGQRILGLPEDGNRDPDHIKMLLQRIKELGPRIVALTDGPAGAYNFDGATHRFCPAYPDIAEPLERTGVGDAYASTFTAYYSLGMSIEDCMLRAPINSMNVVQHVGAQEGLLSQAQINDYLEKSPSDYLVSEL